MGRPDRNTLDKPTKKTCIKDFFNHINAVWSRGAPLFSNHLLRHRSMAFGRLLCQQLPSPVRSITCRVRLFLGWWATRLERSSANLFYTHSPITTGAALAPRVVSEFLSELCATRLTSMKPWELPCQSPVKQSYEKFRKKSFKTPHETRSTIASRIPRL